MLGRGSAVAAGGGAFLGYNTQWQDLVLGVEATYTHVNLNTTASSVPNGVGRFFPDVNTGVNVSASGDLDLTDYGTARGRAGYVVGNFLPYGFIGMAVGRASYSVNTTSLVQQTSNNITQTFLFTNAAGQTNALLWGYTAAPTRLGAHKYRVRGEFEFVQFARSQTLRSLWPPVASAPALSSEDI